MKSLFVIYAVLFGAYIGISLPLPLMGPLLLADTLPFAINASQRYFYLSLALAVFPIGNLIGAPVLGFFADRVGKKKILVLGLFVGGICYALSGIAIALGNLSLLLLSRFFCGLAEGNAAIGQSYIAERAESGTKAKLFGVMIAVISIGYIAGPLLAGLAIHEKTPFSSMSLPFYLVSLFIVATMMFAAIFLGRDRVMQAKAVRFTDGIKKLFCDPTFTRLMILATLLAMGRALYIDFFASFIELRFGLQIDSTTWLWVLLAAVWGLAALAADIGSQRVSYHAKMVMATILASVAVFAISLSHTMPSLVILSVLVVIGCALAGPLNAVLVSDAACKEYMGLAMGLLGSTYLVGEIISAFVGGALLNLDDGAPFILSSALFVVAAMGFFVFFIRPKMQPQILKR